MQRVDANLERCLQIVKVLKTSATEEMEERTPIRLNTSLKEKNDMGLTITHLYLWL